jgi:hypothetical protein
MIDWDKPYGEHFGSKSPARYTQGGKDYDAKGQELDGDGRVVDGEPNKVLSREEFAVLEREALNAAVERGEFSNTRTAEENKKVGVGPGDYKALKKRIGDAAYKKLSGDEKRAAILEYKNA